MKDPPQGYTPPGWTPSATQQKQRGSKAYTLAEAIRTWQWWGLWALWFLNPCAGISIISQAAPMAQEITKVNAATAAELVDIMSIANGIGRFLWAWFSDFVGHRSVFSMMFLAQAVIFWILSRVTSFPTFAALASLILILLCSGGGFGTIPAFAADYFGPENVGSIHWTHANGMGVCGPGGPTLIARVRQSTGRYSEALTEIAIVMLVSTLIPLIVRPPAASSST
jgi:OFA family oxalate/formate antiporter-like MFS transporter